jgi:hypothetical protein
MPSLKWPQYAATFFERDMARRAGKPFLAKVSVRTLGFDAVSHPQGPDASRMISAFATRALAVTAQ